MNEIVCTSTFDRLYKLKIKSHQPSSVIEKIDEAVNSLHEASDPKSLGELKKGELRGTYAISLGYDSRLLYSVEKGINGKTVVTLLRVCNHKKVYGTG